MLKRQFIVTLQDDVVLSQNAATAGGHAGLDYLPGSAFLGAVAEYLYNNSQLTEEEIYTIFHSGNVQFGNGLPLTANGDIGYPIPRCWFHDKSDTAAKENAVNYIWMDFPQNRQPEQYRDIYVPLHKTPRPEDSKLFAFKPQYRMKTAINPDTAIAAENQLFGYSSIAAGSRFHFQITVNNTDKANTIIEKLTETLRNNTIRLGRSRSAEYGTVTISEVKEDVKHPIDNLQNRLTLWLLADCAINDGNGLPTLNPKPELIGLPNNWQLELSKSFIHSRRYAPYNSHYKRHETEREVLGMGSVLHYIQNDSSDTEMDSASLLNLQENGIGLYRQVGLGKIWINPPILSTGKPKFKPPSRQTTPKPKPPKPVTNKLYRYLESLDQGGTEGETIIQAANTLKDELIKKYTSAWRLEPYSWGGQIGPSATQWGRVMEALRSAIENGPSYNLEKTLFDQETGICKEKDDQWKDKIIDIQGDRPKQTTFRQWLSSQFDTLKNESDGLEILALFARLAMDVAREHSCFIPREDQSL